MGCASAQTQSQDRVTGAARSMPDLGNELLQLHAVLRTVWRVALHLAALDRLIMTRLLWPVKSLLQFRKPYLWICCMSRKQVPVGPGRGRT